jgi:hypothetical protein
VEQAIGNTLGVNFWLGDAGRDAVVAWRGWSGPSKHEEGGWPWDELISQYARNPADFRLAIWSDQTLCGLAVGATTDRRRDGRRNAVKVEWVEGNPDPHHPLKGTILEFALTAADYFADAVAADFVKVVTPARRLMDRYEAMGFVLASGNRKPVVLQRKVMAP